jgi:hypothetical protein
MTPDPHVEIRPAADVANRTPNERSASGIASSSAIVDIRQSPGGHDNLGADATRWLASAENASRDVLMGMLSDLPHSVRGSPEAAARVLAWARGENEAVKGQAIRALGMFLVRQHEIVDFLLTTIAERKYAIPSLQALRRIGAKARAARSVLWRLAIHEHGILAELATRAFAAVADREDYDASIDELMRSHEWLVRSATIEATSDINLDTPNVRAAVNLGLRDPDEWVRTAAVKRASMLGVVLDDSSYMNLARSKDSDVRLEMMIMSRDILVASVLRRRIAEIGIQDTDAEVQSAAKEVLVRLTESGGVRER